eukprot:COSAG02_NODE_564_length_20286_cov_52.743696_6_plen_60_part_00
MAGWATSTPCYTCNSAGRQVTCVTTLLTDHSPTPHLPAAYSIVCSAFAAAARRRLLKKT